MIRLVDIKKSIVDVLENNFPTLSKYAGEITEGFKRPCFFNQILPITFDYETTHFTSNKLMIVINYFSANRTDLENIKMYDDLKKVFGMTLKVKHRSFLLQDIRSDITDGVLQFKFDLNFYDDIEISEEEQNEMNELMKELNMNLRSGE